MVGEIRDEETAQIAVQSALTGHLVFTTVHANNVVDVLGRFLNMGSTSTTSSRPELHPRPAPGAVSMQPGLAVAYNEWRTRLPREGAWLVLDESGQTCIALLAGGGLRALYVTRGAIEWRDLLERERLRTAGAELPGAVLVNGALQALPIAA
jgi:hypothetical protein